jgi:hypothetical protein
VILLGMAAGGTCTATATAPFMLLTSTFVLCAVFSNL